MKVVIGLTSKLDFFDSNEINRINQSYVNAIDKAGALPLILPAALNEEDIDSYLNLVDGLVFSGGEDISPLLYGENPIKEVTDICYTRDQVELALFKKAYEKKIPMLGICRGLQLFNVGLGGNLYQDIHVESPEALGHVSACRMDCGYHSIDLDKEGILYKIFGQETININSMHHQAIKNLGQGLRVIARASDGIIEAVESITDTYILAVQFHPEAMAERDKNFLAIFKDFINACKK